MTSLQSVPSPSRICYICQNEPTLTVQPLLQVESRPLISEITSAMTLSLPSTFVTYAKDSINGASPLKEVAAFARQYLPLLFRSQSLKAICNTAPAGARLYLFLPAARHARVASAYINHVLRFYAIDARTRGIARKEKREK